MRLQLFGNMGTLYSVYGVNPLSTHQKPVLRSSVGIGLVCPTPVGRLEMNFW